MSVFTYRKNGISRQDCRRERIEEHIYQGERDGMAVDVGANGSESEVKRVLGWQKLRLTIAFDKLTRLVQALFELGHRRLQLLLRLCYLSIILNLQIFVYNLVRSGMMYEGW